jgi:hypothetical protein
MKKRSSARVHPTGCSCHTLALGTSSFINPETKMPITHDVARRAVRSVTCEVHPPHKYLVRFISRT